MRGAVLECEVLLKERYNKSEECMEGANIPGSRHSDGGHRTERPIEIAAEVPGTAL